MPITFEAPGPVGAIVGINRIGQSSGPSIAEQYSAEMQRGQAFALQNAARMQQDREHQDANLEGQQQFAASRAYSPRDAGMAQAAMAENQQRAQMQQQMQQAEFNHSDGQRLAELNQGKNDIMKQFDSGQINPAERDQMLLQLHTGQRGINVLQLRKEATDQKYQQQHIDQVKQQMKLAAEDSESKGKLEEARLAYSTASLNGKLKEVPHQSVVNELSAQIARDLPDMSPAEVKAEAERQAIAGGHSDTFYPDSKGVPTLVKRDWHGQQVRGEAGPGVPSGQTAGASSRGGGGMKEFNPLEARKEANKEARELAKDGHIKGDEITAKSNEIFNQHLQDHQEYQGSLAQGRAAGKPAPFDLGNPQSGTPQQRKTVLGLQEFMSKLPSLGLDPRVEAQVSHKIQEAQRLTAQWARPDGSMEAAPPHVKKRLEDIDKLIKGIPAQRQQGPAAGTNWQPGQRPGNSDQQNEAAIAAKQAQAAKLQAAGGLAQPTAMPAPQEVPPGQVVLPAHEAVDPHTGARTRVPARLIPAELAPKPGPRPEQFPSRGARYFSQGWDRLRGSLSGEQRAISFEDY